MVIIDTNIIIDYLRRKEKSSFESFFEQKDDELGISLVTIQELFSGKSTKDKEEEDFLLALLASLVIFPYTYEIAKLAGELIRNAKDPIEFPDAAIAATAIFHDAKLFTLNKRDFAKIAKLQLL